MGIWQCLASDDEEINFLELDTSFSTDTYTIPSGFTDSNNQVTMQAWIFRNKAENPTTDETLIDHNKLLKVKFPASDNSRMQIKHLENAANQYSFPVAFNQWIFMTVVSVPSKFTVSIFDNVGK